SRATRVLIFTRGLSSVSDLLVRGVTDESPLVKINTLVALASYHDSTLAVRVTPLLDDPLPNAQVQAADALGQLGGSEAARGLLKVLKGKRTFAAQRAALVALARVDPSAFTAAS